MLLLVADDVRDDTQSAGNVMTMQWRHYHYDRQTERHTSNERFISAVHYVHLAPWRRQQ